MKKKNLKASECLAMQNE